MAELQTRLIKGLNLLESAPMVQMEGFEKKKSRNIISMLLKLTSAAAVLILAVLFTINYFSFEKSNGTKTFLAAYGERKNTPAMEVKALGTVFNVKAYLNDKTTETSLIRGLRGYSK